jgi:phenylpropionate dioxygenase-like ring-hydroxylating dioxygenase large terminal subunit
MSDDVLNFYGRDIMPENARTLPARYYTDPALLTRELDGLFGKMWFYVGRSEEAAKPGQYFIREINGHNIVVSRNNAGQVRAFHNICRHRGNKLVWQDYPGEETSGTCRQFTCKYHGWRYSLSGDLTFVQQEDEFFDLDRGDFGLVPVQAEVWEGFIFVNLDADNKTSLREYLGEFGAIEYADAQSRENYVWLVRTEAERRGMGAINANAPSPRLRQRDNTKSRI